MRHAVRIAAFALGCSSLLALSACGEREIGLAKSNPDYKGALIFSQRCAGCHSLDVAGTEGSARLAKDKEQTDGPNFNQRREVQANVLYALRNGGFSGKIMPQNLVTGDEAVEVAAFLAKYAGADAKNPAAPVRNSTLAQPIDSAPSAPKPDPDVTSGDTGTADSGAIAPDTTGTSPDTVTTTP